MALLYCNKSFTAMNIYYNLKTQLLSCLTEFMLLRFPNIFFMSALPIVIATV